LGYGLADAGGNDREEEQEQKSRSGVGVRRQWGSAPAAVVYRFILFGRIAFQSPPSLADVLTAIGAGQTASTAGHAASLDESDDHFEEKVAWGGDGMGKRSVHRARWHKLLPYCSLRHLWGDRD
jgi:hypothetical protein